MGVTAIQSHLTLSEKGVIWSQPPNKAMFEIKVDEKL